MYVWVGHALGFDHHHGLVLDPALSAGFPKVGQESGLVGQDFLKGRVLVVVVEDGVEIPVVKVPIQIPAQVFLRHPLVDPGLPLRGGPLIGSALDPLGVNPEGLHFPVFDGPASLHHPVYVWHGAPSFTGAGHFTNASYRRLRGHGPAEKLSVANLPGN